jgi:hypothetical protein
MLSQALLLTGNRIPYDHLSFRRNWEFEGFTSEQIQNILSDFWMGHRNNSSVGKLAVGMFGRTVHCDLLLMAAFS